jgi:hypothetical protein
MKKRQIKYVLTAQPKRPNSKYWDSEGKKTILPLAAKFYSHGDAMEFADAHGIIIDEVMNSVVVKA